MTVRSFVRIAALTLLFGSGAAVADQYSVTAGWTDPTTYNPADAPTYELRYRVAGGAETVLPGLTSPAASFTVNAAPGQPIEVQVRARNLGLDGPLSEWVTATASYPATVPATQTGITLTVIRTGP